MELINKLQAAGLLGEDLLHSINGREYVTAAYLKTEVLDAVTSAGGRVPVVSLPHGLQARQQPTDTFEMEHWHVMPYVCFCHCKHCKS